MAITYPKLLEATIQHLEELKARGARFVSVSPAALASLTTARRQSIATATALQCRSAAAPPPTQPAFRPGATHVQATLPSAPPSTAVPAPKSFDAKLSTSAAPEVAPLSREAKQAAMAELQGRAMGCRKCPHLASSRKNVVFGVGDIHSPLMFVGEAPGADEDQQGEPFVGKAGQLLTRIIQTMGFSRESVYIANILKCRPDTPGKGTGNRKPTADEMRTCLPYLLVQIDLIAPKVIVALGATAVEGLFGKTTGITRLRGHWQTLRDIAVMPTYHPAYLLRNESLSEKRKVWEDMLQVLERLERPISPKQRNYFLGG